MQYCFLLFVTAMFSFGCTQIHPQIESLSSNKIAFSFDSSTLSNGKICLDHESAKDIKGTCDKRVKKIYYKIGSEAIADSLPWVEAKNDEQSVSCETGNFQFSLPLGVSIESGDMIFAKTETEVAASDTISYPLLYSEYLLVSSLGISPATASGESLDLQILGGQAPYSFLVPDERGTVVNGGTYFPPIVQENINVPITVKDSSCSKPLELVVSVMATPGPVAVLNNLPQGYSSSKSLNASVTGTGVISYVYKISQGTNCDLEAPFSNSKVVSVPIQDDIHLLTDGPVTLCVKGYNANGGEGQIVATNWIKDTTPPTAPTSFDDGVTAIDSESPIMTWSASNDSVSGVDHYEVAVGSSSGGTDVVTWTSTTNLSFQFKGLSLALGQKYYASIRAIDKVGNISTVVNGDGWTAAPVGSFTKVFGTSIGMDVIKSVVADDSGNIFVGGYFQTSSGLASALSQDFSGNSMALTSGSNNTSSNYVGFVAKLDLSGKQLWLKFIDGRSIDSVNGLAINGTSALYVAGYFSNDSIDSNNVLDFNGNKLNGKTSTSSMDSFVAKLDPSTGTMSWISVLGGAGEDSANAVAVDALNNVIVGGYFQNNNNTSNTNPNISNNTGATDFNAAVLGGRSSDITNESFIAKLNSSGVQSWVKVLGGSGGDQVNSLALDTNNNVLATGLFTNNSLNDNGVKDFNTTSSVLGLSATSGQDLFVSKLSSSGTYAWTKTIGGAGDLDRGNAILIDLSGSIFVGGTVNADLNNTVLLKTSSGVMISGNNIEVSENLLVAKYDSTGAVVWVKTMGGSSSDRLLGLAFDKKSGALFATGTITSDKSNSTATKDFSGNPVFGAVGGAPTQDSLIMKFTSDGATNWAKTAGGIHIEYGFGIAVDSVGGIWTGGLFFNDSTNSKSVTDYSGNSVFGIGQGVYIDAFLMRYVP